jgi:EAL domain-containing protein (putative c-di-GMP-specific phosphodiesterase class I)
MYKAKDKGRNNFQFYTPELNANFIQTMTLKNDLRGAIDRDELSLYYQPKINILDNKIVGAEALLRWQHPIRGMVPPNEFIPIAEQSGLIFGIGQWVISEAIKQTKKWQDKLLPNFGMAINLSVKQFQNRELVDFINTEITKLSVAASTIELEITESLLMEESQQEHEILQELSNKGFKISMDDFGTGYSSLSYLKRFTIDVLKIDRSFICDVMSNPDDAEIVKAIIVMAHALKLTVVAEGVENKEQLGFLKQLNCDQTQGFLVSKPIPALEFEQLFKEVNESK